MSGYLEGVLVLLAINVVYAYAAFLPIAAGQLNLGVAGFAAVGGYASAYLSTERKHRDRWQTDERRDRIARSTTDNLEVENRCPHNLT